jgi:hypothetical protein
MAYDSSLTLATNNLRMTTKAYATGNDLPADTVAFGASWGTGWVDLGGTEGGIGFAFNAQRADLKIDQSPTAIKRPFTDERLEIRTVMAEITPANLLFATGQGAVTVTNPVSGTRGRSELVISGNPVDQYRSFGAEALMDDNEPFRILFPYAVATGSPNLQLRAAQLAGIELVASGFPDPTTQVIAKVRDVIQALP